MDEDHGEQRAGLGKEEGDVGAKEGGVGELDDGAGDGGVEGHGRVSEAELVEVVDVGAAKDERREEDDAGGCGLGEEEEGNYGGAKEAFFGDGALKG